MKLEILYTAWNRLEFTTASWAWMMSHTALDYVSHIVAYDDGSEDGTQEFLREAVEKVNGIRKLSAELRIGDFRSPPAIMNHYLATTEADVFVKIDNDIALCGGWLERMLGVWHDHPDLDLLGMEAGMVALDGRDGKTYRKSLAEPCTNIGGVGMMRVSGFRSRPPLPTRGRYGFTEWQQRYDVPRAWIVPDVHVPQLDRLPFEPWLSLTETYIEAGWSRPWPKYDLKWMAPYWEWMQPQEIEA